MKEDRGMAEVETPRTGQPLARYSSWRRAGDIVYMSGVIAVDPASGTVLQRFDQVPESVRRALGQTGELSVDVFQAPVLVQSWVVLDRIRQLAEEAGGAMADVIKLVQYFTDLRDYPLYNRVRRDFFADAPPVSTVVEVSGMLPSRDVRIEVEATAYIPRKLEQPGGGREPAAR
jgi:enamine deaminase RidA (YjgF/YER057c/UK114 family)